MENNIENINKINYISWIRMRMIQLNNEINIQTNLKLKIIKKAKLKGYKECLDYIETH
jgi:hypothetical protein